MGAFSWIFNYRKKKRPLDTVLFVEVTKKKMIADQKCATVTHSAQCFSEPFSTLRKWRYQPINNVSLFSIGNAPFRLVSRYEERDLRNQAKTKNSRK